MEDKFFSKKYCDRCGNVLDARTMSWFNDDTICMNCSDKESAIKKKLQDGGKSYEGCGYIPDVNKQEAIK
ncbi:MAG: gamma-glutamylcyclotransferase [Bacteroidetes bacterium]|nr:MAG: gamma-glutamylcyclotransferase [Bacteroidota bacterium]